jgi:hypothetical protein
MVSAGIPEVPAFAGTSGGRYTAIAQLAAQACHRLRFGDRHFNVPK